ncbi:MAG: nicotinamide mononucleotide transporter [Armatimonadetes bacterium]|nr:nicotinamide mononucleotide transporter [Armatimonadota bacterium]
MRRTILGLGAAASAALIAASWRHWLPMDLTEVFGFVTGAWCVWLTVEENVWNWPIGIANDIFFIVLFLRARLFADMGLQVVYVVLGILGWYWWLHGGRGRTVLHVSRASAATALTLAALGTLSTFGMTLYLRHVRDSAPFWDALTTALSLAAQYLLTKKLIENWHVWMSADVIYVALYAYKHLYLTGGLYLLFLALCVMGLRQWRESQASHPSWEGMAESVHG